MMTANQRKLAIAAAIVLFVALCGAILLPGLARPSNCGGNSAALSACRMVALNFRIISLDRGEKPVSVAELTDSERGYFKQVGGLNWLGDARILVTTVPVSDDQKQRCIVAICDTPFDNVPQKLFGKAPLTHAVAYSDESYALISIEEFQKLDLSGFVDVRTVQPTNSLKAASNAVTNAI